MQVCLVDCGRLFAAALLSIFNGLIQAPPDDIKGGFVEVCKASASGATTSIFNGLGGPGGGFLYDFSSFNFGFNSVLVAAVFGRIDNIFTGAVETLNTVFSDINESENKVKIIFSNIEITMTLGLDIITNIQHCIFYNFTFYGSYICIHNHWQLTKK